LIFAENMRELLSRMFTPKYTITNKILKYIASIETSREIIENAPLVPAWQDKLRRDAMLRSVHYGTHIEGNDLNISEAEEVLAGREVDGRDRDIQEVLNFRRVMEYVDKIGRKKAMPSVKDMLEIHRLTVDKILWASEAGHFRDKNVVVKSKGKGVSFTPPEHGVVAQEVDNFFDWLKRADPNDLHPTIIAGVTHYELARIHPFIDGNGRTARALATLVLFASGYDIKKFFALEEYYDRHLQNYYDVLKEVSDQLVSDESHRDLTPWLEYFVEGLASELGKVKEKVRELSMDVKLRGKVGQIALSERQMRLVEYMEKWGEVKGSAWRQLIPGVSDDTILRDLKDLQKKGLVKKKGSTKGAVYMLK